MIEYCPFVLSLPVLSKVEGSKHEFSFFSTLLEDAPVRASLLSFTGSLAVLLTAQALPY